MSGKREGLLFSVEDSLFFVPASIAMRVTTAPRVTSVPGAPEELVGIALHGGAVIAVIAVGPELAEMIVCQHAGELVGIVGGHVVASGRFELVSTEPDVVRHGDERANTLDVPALYARIQAGGGKT